MDKFEIEWKKYCASKGDGAVTMNVKEVAKHFAEWQREQMMKDAIDSIVVKPDYQARGVVKSIRLQIDDDSIACAYDKGEKVKVIIIKE